MFHSATHTATHTSTRSLTRRSALGTAALGFGPSGSVAINGYDTVAYFTVGKPVKGLDTLATDWIGST